MKEKYLIRYGTFGLDDNFDLEEFESQEEANNYAYEMACEDYDSFAGSQGIMDIDEIREEYDCEDDDEANQAYAEERESWIQYDAKIPTKDDYENYGL